MKLWRCDACYDFHHRCPHDVSGGIGITVVDLVIPYTTYSEHNRFDCSRHRVLTHGHEDHIARCLTS